MQRVIVGRGSVHSLLLSLLAIILCMPSAHAVGVGNFKNQFDSAYGWSVSGVWDSYWISNTGANSPGTCVMKIKSGPTHSTWTDTGTPGDSKGTETVTYNVDVAGNCTDGGGTAQTQTSFLDISVTEKRCTISTAPWTVIDDYHFVQSSFDCQDNACAAGTAWDTDSETCVALGAEETTDSDSCQVGDSIYYQVSATSSGIQCAGGCELMNTGRELTIDGTDLRIGYKTGRTCEGATESQLPDSETGKVCVSSGDGLTQLCTVTQPDSCGTVSREGYPDTYVCEQKPNCGSVNGVDVCLDAIPTNGCTFLPGGLYACDSNVIPAYKPNNGTVGTPAAPTAEIKGDGGQTVQVWNSETVNNSSTTVVNHDGDGGRNQNLTAATEGTGQDILQELRSIDEKLEPGGVILNAPASSEYAIDIPDTVDSLVQTAPIGDITMVPGWISAVSGYIWPADSSSTCPLLSYGWDEYVPGQWSTVCDWIQVVVKIADFVLGIMVFTFILYTTLRAAEL